MSTTMKALLCAAGVFALSACTQGTMREFYSEAGAEVDEGGFGNPTMSNMLAQSTKSCVGRAKGYIVPDPIVVLDPNSPPDYPRYRHAQVRCSGELDGKYARLIYGAYVGSAGQPISVAQASAGGEG